MIKLFRTNDPYRLVLLTIALIVGRVVIFAIPLAEVTRPDLDFAGAISDGLLNGVDKEVGPLYMLLWQLVDLTNGIWLSAVLAGVFVLINTVLISDLFIRNNALKDNTYIPGLFYILLTLASKSSLLLSPQLVGMTFLLLALGFLLDHIKFRGSEENILSTGVTIGLAALFFIPYAVFWPIVILIYIFYSSTLSRRYFLMSFGFLLPIIVVFTYFLYSDKHVEFLTHIWSSIANIGFKPQALTMGKVVVLPLVFSLWGALTSFSGARMTNHQIYVQRIMTWLLFFALFVGTFYLVKGGIIHYEFLSLPMAYFLSKNVLGFNKKWKSEALVWLVLLNGIVFLFI
ncbi:DUF6427 family protein [Roseivirga pacifica]|uniref:DUF6427 family protein n=1 Tax=Roseivirga pacifica TaxID=1267423 RepID=UPI003BB1DCA6